MPASGEFRNRPTGFETMSRNTGERQERLATDVRRQLGEGATTRFLRAMPTFKVVKDMPRHMTDLLDRLEETEGKHAGSSR